MNWRLGLSVRVVVTLISIAPRLAQTPAAPQLPQQVTTRRYAGVFSQQSARPQPRDHRRRNVAIASRRRPARTDVSYGGTSFRGSAPARQPSTSSADQPLLLFKQRRGGWTPPMPAWRRRRHAWRSRWPRAAGDSGPASLLAPGPVARAAGRLDEMERVRTSFAAAPPPATAASTT